MRNEQTRYAAVQAQIEQFMAEAANSKNPATSILWAQLISEMVKKNEQSSMAHNARVGIVTALESRIQAKSAEPVNWREEVRKWHEEEQIAIAYLKHGTVPIPPKPESEGER